MRLSRAREREDKARRKRGGGFAIERLYRVVCDLQQSATDGRREKKGLQSGSRQAGGLAVTIYCSSRNHEGCSETRGAKQVG